MFECHSSETPEEAVIEQWNNTVLLQRKNMNCEHFHKKNYNNYKVSILINNPRFYKFLHLYPWKIRNIFCHSIVTLQLLIINLWLITNKDNFVVKLFLNINILIKKP